MSQIVLPGLLMNWNMKRKMNRKAGGSDDLKGEIFKCASMYLNWRFLNICLKSRMIPLD